MMSLNERPDMAALVEEHINARIKEWVAEHEAAFEAFFMESEGHSKGLSELTRRDVIFVHPEMMKAINAEKAEWKKFYDVRPQLKIPEALFPYACFRELGLAAARNMVPAR